MPKLISQICLSFYFTAVLSITTLYIDPNSVLDGNGTEINPFKYFRSVQYNTFNESLAIFILNDYVFEDDSDFINVQDFDQDIRLLIFLLTCYSFFAFLIIKFVVSPPEQIYKESFFFKIKNSWF